MAILSYAKIELGAIQSDMQGLKKVHSIIEKNKLILESVKKDSFDIYCHKSLNVCFNYTE